MQILLDNWQLVVSVLVFTLAFFQGASWFRYVRFVRRLAEAAWAFAEEEGILKDINGADKVAPFLEYFLQQWEQRFGETAPPKAQGMAMRIAAEESIKHKVAELSSPKSLLSSDSAQ